MTYLKLKKLYGHYKNSSFLNPRIGKQSDFIFPKMSLLVWLDFTIEYTPKHNHLLTNTNKPNLFIIDTLKNVSKGAKRNSIKSSQMLNEIKRNYKDIKFISLSKSLLMPPSSMLVGNVSLINEFYRYKNTPIVLHDQVMDKINCAIETINDKSLGIGRQKYVTIELPTNLPSYVTMEKLIKHNPKKLLGELNDKRTMLFLELYKWLDDDLETKSVFNNIHEDMYSKTEIILTYEDKFILINLNDFKALNKNKKLLSEVKGFSDTQAKKVLLLLAIKTILEPGVDINELGKYDSVGSNSGITEVTLDNIDELLETSENDISSLSLVETKEEKDTVEVTEDIVVPTLDELYSTNKSTEESIIEELELALHKGDLTEAQVNKQLKYLEEQKEITGKLVYTKDEKELIKSLVDLPDNKAVEDKTLLHDTIGGIKKTYIEKSHEKNISRVLYGIQSSGHIVTSVEKVDTEDILGDYTEYSIKLATADKLPVTVKFRIPKLSEDGTFKISGNEYLMRSQRSDVPIKKTAPNTVILSSYYGKLTIERDKYSKNNLAIQISKQLEKNENILNLVLTDSYIDEQGLPYLYTNISKSVKSFELGKLYFHYSYKTRHILVNKGDDLVKLEKHGVLMGKEGRKYLLMKDDTILTYDGKESKVLGSVYEVMDINIKSIPPQVSTMKVFSKSLPLILIMLHKYTFGQLLKLTKATYKKVPFSRGLRIEEDEFKIIFVDYIYIFKRDNRVNEMLYGGLLTIPELSTMYIKNFDNVNGLTNVGALMGVDRNIITEIKNRYNMFIDPMTKNLLTIMKEPTTFIGLLLRANELLLEDYAPDTSSLDYMKIVGDERIAGIIYKELTKSIKKYESSKHTSRAKITMNPYDVWATINSDSTTVLVEDLNPIGLLKQYEDVTYTGSGGRNKDTMVKKTRAYHVSDVGVISEAVKDSTDVGISMYMSANPKLDGTTGLKLKDGKELSKANIFSTSSLIFTDNDKDDAKRLNFTSIQSGHVTPMLGQMILPVRSPYHSVIGSRLPDKFVATALSKGKVIELTDSTITIKYTETKETKDYSLVDWYTKEVGGRTFRHRMFSSLVRGSTVDVGDVICYDSAFFGIDLFDPSKVVMKSGRILRTQFIEDSDTYEDSISLNTTVTKELTVPVTMTRSIVIDKTFNISKVKQLGTSVSSLEALMLMTDGNTGEQDLGKQLNLDDDTLSILNELNDSSPKAKYKGTVTNIVCYYNCELKELSSSLRTLVNSSNERLSKKANKKVEGKVSSGYSIKGKPLTEGKVEIKFYIEHEADGSIGDKFVFGNQLKGTISNVYSDRTTENGRVIEAEFSTKGEAARIVNSSDLTGVKTTILREASLIAGMMD